MKILFIFLFVFLLSIEKASSQCSAGRRTFDSPAFNPGIASIPNPTTYGAYAGTNCSELVNVFTMGNGNPTWPRTNCPHLTLSGLTPFEVSFPSLVAGSDVTITSGMKLLFRNCSLGANPAIVLNRILIQSGGYLVFDDTDTILNVREIQVNAGGYLLIGSETCRLYSTITITFYGSKADSSVNLFDTPTGKGLESLGTVDIHGKQYHPTWTKLSRSVKAGTSVIFLQDPVNWEVGQTILIATSIWYDCPPQFQVGSCNNYPQQNEIRVIKGLAIASNGEQAIELTTPLNYFHYAGIEYQIEVSLLSRRINFVGSDSGDEFGGHTLSSGSGIARYSGVRGDRMGQKNVLGRYPFHFHMMNDAAGAQSYFQDCSVTNSFFRCYTVHETNYTRLSRNTAFNASGHCFYLEDGVEENNLLEYNFGAYVIPIGTPANGGWGQGANDQTENANLINPADTSASVYYILDAYNTFIGNAASGGWSGFAFPNAPYPVFAAKGMDKGNLNPLNRPTKLFQGNSAHSTGFYWLGHGSAMYIGAWFAYNSNVLTYNSGRYSRNTCNPDGSAAWMRFYDTKTFLTLKGVAHWGERHEMERYEAHDVYAGAMLFGEAGIYDGLLNAFTPNPSPYRSSKEIFQMYDTWVKTVLVRVTFRNVGASDSALRYMDHSDQYLNQGINAVSMIGFQNVTLGRETIIHECGSVCGTSYSTMSSRLYSVMDFDGTLSKKPGTPSILASPYQWWNIDSTCEQSKTTYLWRCDWYSNRIPIYLELNVPGLYDGCHSNVGNCTRGYNDQQAKYTVGYVNQFGKNSTFGIKLSPWAGITGMSNMGWYWRVKVENVDGTGVRVINGAPSYFEINSMQMPRGKFIVLAVAYPTTAQFSVKLFHWGTLHTTLLMASSKAAVLNSTENLNDPSVITCLSWPAPWDVRCNNTGGIGPAWYFDSTSGYFYLRVVNYLCYVSNGYQNCASYYNFHGDSINDITNEFSWQVTVTSCSGCTAQAVFQSITYYDVADTIVPTPFVMTPGSLVTVPNVQASSFHSSKTCPTSPNSTPQQTSSAKPQSPKPASKSPKPQSPKPASKSPKPQTAKPNSKSAKPQSPKPASKSAKPASKSAKPASKSPKHPSKSPKPQSAKPNSKSARPQSARPNSKSVRPQSKSNRPQSRSPRLKCATVPTGSVSFSTAGTCVNNAAYGTTCSLGCQSTYTPSGSLSTTCGTTTAGQWTTITGSCSASSSNPCNTLPPLVSNESAGNCVAGAADGSTCMLACNSGYTVSSGGSLSATCVNGAWSVSSTTTCNKNCATLPTLPAHVVAGQCTKNFPSGSSCTLGCAKGYKASGSLNIQCSTSGSWSTISGQCVSKQAATNSSSVAANAPVIGGVIGGIVALAAIALAAFTLKKRRQQSSQKSSNPVFEMSFTGNNY